MRKIAILICVLVLIIPRARAQDEEIVSSSSSFDYSFGVKVGLVSSDFAQSFQKLETTESRTGFSAGLYGTFQITDLIGITVEALYVQEGTMRLDPNYIYYSEGINADGYNVIDEQMSNLLIRRVNSNVTLHNFEFPLLVNFSAPAFGDFKLKAYVGGSFDYIYRAYTNNLLALVQKGNASVLHEEAYVLSDRYSDNITSAFGYYNISGIIGVGVEYKAYTLDVRYKAGFVDINNLASYNLQNQYLDDFTSNAFMISLGVNLKQLLNL